MACHKETPAATDIQRPTTIDRHRLPACPFPQDPTVCSDPDQTPEDQRSHSPHTARGGTSGPAARPAD